MHVGYVLKKFPRASETFILNEILALQRQGVEVTVFSLNKPDCGVFHRGLADLQRPVVYVPPRKAEAWSQHLRGERARLAELAPAVLDQLDHLLAAERPDTFQVLGQGFDVAAIARQHGVQHLHAHFATVAANVARAAGAFARLPFSVTCHAKDIYRTGIDPDVFRSLLGPAAFAVTVCEANRRWIESELAGERPIDLRVLYNGVDTELFHPRDRRQPAEPFVLGVGRLVEKKGFHHLLDALAQLSARGLRPPCRIVGDGEERVRLLAQRDRLGLSEVEFVGLRNQDDVRRLMQQATLFVLPCRIGEDGNRDALPTVLLEALAQGLPVISTAVGGVEEIVDHGRAGLLTPIGDEGALAAAIEQLWLDPGRRDRLAVVGRERAEELFDLEKNVGRLREHFEGAVAAAEGQR